MEYRFKCRYSFDQCRWQGKQRTNLFKNVTNSFFFLSQGSCFVNQKNLFLLMKMNSFIFLFCLSFSCTYINSSSFFKCIILKKQHCFFKTIVSSLPLHVFFMHKNRKKTTTSIVSSESLRFFLLL